MVVVLNHSSALNLSGACCTALLVGVARRGVAVEPHRRVGVAGRRPGTPLTVPDVVVAGFHSVRLATAVPDASDARQ